MDFIFLSNETFGIGVDVYSDAEIHEITLGLGFWDLAILIHRPSPLQPEQDRAVCHHGDAAFLPPLLPKSPAGH